jgi:predicted enzyme related to lactoylglutathione lyase
MKRQLCLFLALLGAGSACSVAGSPPELPPLTAVENSPRLPGKFIWADLITDDVSAARNFYSRLFGWSFREVGNYSIAANDDRPLAGMFQRARPQDRPAKPRWICYMSVSSVSDAQDKVVKEGGKVLAAMKNYPKRGDQAVFADSEGAVFGAIASRRGDPEDFLPAEGDWIWVQLLSHDASKAGEFYRRIAGYEVMPYTGRTNSCILVSKGYARAAVMTLPPDKASVMPAWLPFVRVPSLDKAIAQAKELGGKILLEPRPDLFQGKVSVIADPTGAAIGILEWSGELATGGQKP